MPKYIDADALVEQLNDDANRLQTEEAINDWQIGKRILSRASAADVAPIRHGEWHQVEVIDDDSETGVNDSAAQCSICQDVHNSIYWARTYYNFCPNCGAKMDDNGK